MRHLKSPGLNHSEDAKQTRQFEESVVPPGTRQGLRDSVPGAVFSLHRLCLQEPRLAAKAIWPHSQALRMSEGVLGITQEAGEKVTFSQISKLNGG